VNFSYKLCNVTVTYAIAKWNAALSTTSEHQLAVVSLQLVFEATFLFIGRTSTSSFSFLELFVPLTACQ